ncbi:MAG: hypothetical protein K8R41_05415 [Bacteroidales bacterium]|nr:hypothetical protein [Bacteroidales bacterium]
MAKLKYRYKYIWIIASKWRGFHKMLHKEFPELNNGFPKEYKSCLLSSAVRGASLMYVLSKTTGTEFNQLNALNTGLLSALFDDMIDDELEEFSTISNLISEPDNAIVKSHNSKITRNLYVRLLKNLNPWQQKQLSEILIHLLEIEKFAKVKKNGEWKKRGTYAFFVYLTIICIKLKDVNKDIALKYGEYLQLLDDYEDLHDDDAHDNYFRTHPDFKLTNYYLNEVKPYLTSIFKCDYDKKFFLDFVETYHVFQIRSFKYKHEKENSFFTIRRNMMNFFVSRLNKNVPF